METKFPDHDQGNIGYRCFFLAGWRKSSTGATERTGTVVLKRTYTIDPQQQTLTPAIHPLPIFLQDVPDNLVRNGNFEEELFNDTGQPTYWQPESDAVPISRVVDPTVPEKQNHLLKINGAARGRVVQTIKFGEPLGNQSFSINFSAGAAVTAARIEGVQLEADGAKPICSVNNDLEIGKKLLVADGIWESENLETNMCIVLCMSTDAGSPVFYENVQVYNTLLYEHDLASLKPNGDVIVLGSTNLPVGAKAQVQVNGTVWLARTIGATDRHHLFGWASRVSGERYKQTGNFSDNKADYPLKQLPEKFQNLFYNGYRRDATSQPLPYLPSTAQIVIGQQEEDKNYHFKLRGDTVMANYYYYQGAGTDKAESWQRREVFMNLDTLVIEPDKNQCYLVWRGVWSFDEHPEDVYRLLEVRATA